MSFLGGSSKSKSAPALAAPQALPSEGSGSVVSKADDTWRKMQARLGRQGTILTALGGPQQQLGSIGV